MNWKQHYNLMRGAKDSMERQTKIYFSGLISMESSQVMIKRLSAIEAAILDIIRQPVTED